MDIKLSHCFLAVDDPDKALHFYRDVLGFEVRSEVGKGTMRWITMAVPAQPGLEIVLTPPAAHPHASPADREAVANLMAKGLYGALVFSTDDCDAVFEHVQAAGAEVMQEPIDQPYGVRDCAFRDPAGNMIRFNQAPR
jgi:catechol 2,3-dioxygenase-like lactoylglutathione lyase family enzyme